MKTVTIRIDDHMAQMLSEVDYRPTTAAQNSIELFSYLRRTTLIELKGIFTREEITVLADSFNGVIPTWKYFPVRDMLIAELEDSNSFEGVCARHGANFDQLIRKIKALTSAQVAILQLELYRFWNVDGEGGYGSPSPDLEGLFFTFGVTNASQSEKTESDNSQSINC